MSVLVKYVLTTLTAMLVFAVLDRVFGNISSPEAALIVGFGVTWAMNKDRINTQQQENEK